VLSISERLSRKTDRLYVFTISGVDRLVSTTKMENLFQPTPIEWFDVLKKDIISKCDKIARSLLSWTLTPKSKGKNSAYVRKFSSEL